VVLNFIIVYIPTDKCSIITAVTLHNDSTVH